jgi:pimeloyl-ACP methyl ester carboxylesterase
VSDGRHTVAALAEAVDGTLRSAGVTRAVIVGHSLGALVAWHVALRAPDRVEALVSVDGTLLPFLDDGDAATTFAAGISGADMRPFIDGLRPDLFVDATPPQLRESVVTTMRGTSPRVLAELMSDVAVTGGPPFAPGQLHVPTLAIVASSPQTPADHEALLRALFTTLDYRALQNAGHYLMMERPRDVNDAIAGFLLGRGLLR